MEKSVYFCTSFILQLHYNIYSETSITIKDETSLFGLLLKHILMSRMSCYSKFSDYLLKVFCRFLSKFCIYSKINKVFAETN